MKSRGLFPLDLSAIFRFPLFLLILLFLSDFMLPILHQFHNPLAADLKRLDALTRVFTETQTKNDQFGDPFWSASKQLADERGTKIIPALMKLSQQWHGEEGMIFVPLVSGAYQ